jgi:NADH-quinone oxidoreductase subunit J
MTPDLVLFSALALVAILSAIAMIGSRNAVYSALFLVLNFITIATIYLLLNAAFIAMVQVTVYAGAIMVLFLFVIMLLGSEREERTSAMPWQAPTAFVFSIALLIIIAGALLLQEGGIQMVLGDLAAGFGSPASVGQILFNKYLIPFEVTSLLLLVAMVGAIVLTRGGRKDVE